MTHQRGTHKGLQFPGAKALGHEFRSIAPHTRHLESEERDQDKRTREMEDHRYLSRRFNFDDDANVVRPKVLHVSEEVFAAPILQSRSGIGMLQGSGVTTTDSGRLHPSILHETRLGSHPVGPFAVLWSAQHEVQVAGHTVFVSGKHPGVESRSPQDEDSSCSLNFVPPTSTLKDLRLESVASNE